MKLHLTRFALAAAIAVFLSSCTKTDVEVPSGGGDDDKVAATIHAGIGGSAGTRAHDAEWDENDAIGLAMLDNSGTHVIQAVYNYHYITSEQLGIFEPHSSAMMVYFPADGSLVTFRAYYPFYNNLDEDMLIPVDVSDQTILPDIDLMSADHVAGYSKRDPTVRLYFHHRLSKLIFKLSSDNENAFPSFEDCTVTVRGMKSTGTYHLLEEQLEVDGGSGVTLTFPERDNDATERYGIVLPREAGEGVEFDFTFPDGSSYTAKMSENLELLAGYQYTFYINLKETAATVSAEIAEWIEAPARYYDSVQASVEAGESVNVEEGTVMDVFLSGDNQDYSPLASFEYYADGKWYPDTNVYWESIQYNPAFMRSSIVMADPLNSTQAGDWLTSEMVTVARNTGANFKLSRAVSKVYVTLVSDQFDEDELNSAAIILPDYQTGGYLQNGEFIEGADRNDILLAADPGNGTRAATSETSVAIFQPQSISAGGTIVSVSLNGRIYDVEAPEGGFTFRPGIAEQLVIRLNKEGVTVSATVVDWELGPVTSFDAVQVATVAGESHNVEPGDVIDVYMRTGSAYDYFSTYTYNENGNWYGAPVKYWEDIADDPAYFIARMDDADALDPSQLPDVLLSLPTEGYSNTGVDFELTHAASKVIVALVSDTFSDASIAAASITLPGYTTGGEFDGAVLKGGSSTGDIKVVRTDDISGVAVFEPQTIDAGDPTVRITLNGKTYTALAPAGGIEYKAGVATTLIVKFEKEAVSLSVSVTDWEKETIQLETVRVTATAGETEGVLDGEQMAVYTGVQRQELATYTYSGSTWTGSDPVYWEDLDDPTTFYGSILRQPAYNDSMPDDYLLSGPTTVAAGNAVDFTLSHAVAQVAVQLKSSDNTFSADELEAMDVILPNYATGGTYSNGVFIPGQGTGNVEIEKNVGEDDESGLAFVQPQTIAAGTTVASITGGNRTYTVNSTSPVHYRAGYTTTLVIDMRKTGILISAKVIDWVEGQTITMVPDPIDLDATLEENDGFFVGKTIYVYNMTDNTNRLPYSLQGGQWTGSNLYWDDYMNSGLSLTAVYYPYNEYIPKNLDGQTGFAWNLPADQSDGWEDRDLLMSHIEKAPQVYSYFNFNFRHVVSRVRVLLTSSEFTDAELAGATVTLNNFILNGTANLSTGEINPSTATAPSLTPYTETDGREFSALVMPQRIDPGTQILTVKLTGYPDKEFTGTLSGNNVLSFTPGYITTINLDLQLTEILLSATLEKWEENGNGSVIIN